MHSRTIYWLTIKLFVWCVCPFYEEPYKHPQRQPNGAYLL